MIREIHVENFKSIEKLTLELGRINVFIGENGCGKSNILEAIAFGSAASQEKLDNEFLPSRGLRVPEPRFMRCAFDDKGSRQDIKIAFSRYSGSGGEFIIQSDATQAYSRWTSDPVVLDDEFLKRVLDASGSELEELIKGAALDDLMRLKRFVGSAALDELKKVDGTPWGRYLIYAPENTALRNFQTEGQILPLGSKGEGLFAHLRALGSEKNRPLLEAIIAKLSLIDWFDSFDLPANLSPGERTIHIRDRYLAEGALFDQRSANEGFLFLLFYFTLFISPDTPKFFAVDNVDTSLNPKLCARLITELSKLAKKHDKQAILTTHNPAVLDGLDLHDDEQRLFVIHRASRGPTKARRIEPPKPVEGQLPMKLSEAFLGGYIGGLPKNF